MASRNAVLSVPHSGSFSPVVTRTPSRRSWRACCARAASGHAAAAPITAITSRRLNRSPRVSANAMRSRGRRHVPGGRGHLAKLLRAVRRGKSRGKSRPALCGTAGVHGRVARSRQRNTGCLTLREKTSSRRSPLTDHGLDRGSECIRCTCRGEMQKKTGNELDFSLPFSGYRLVHLNAACRSTVHSGRITSSPQQAVSPSGYNERTNRWRRERSLPARRKQRKRPVQRPVEPKP
jgi:hypothetical protein